MLVLEIVLLIPLMLVMVGIVQKISILIVGFMLLMYVLNVETATSQVQKNVVFELNTTIFHLH